jgi:hypothetical protein
MIRYRELRPDGRAAMRPSPSGAQYGLPSLSNAMTYPLRQSRSALALDGETPLDDDGAIGASEQAAINRPATAASSSFFTGTSSTKLIEHVSTIRAQLAR